MRFFLLGSSSEWSLYRILFEIIINLKSWELIQWFVFSTVSMSLTTYFNVSFFSSVRLRDLILSIIFENITSYCFLQQSQAKKTFVLDFLKHFQTKLNQRILSANWLQIKLSDQGEIRQKIDDACSSVGHLVEQLIDHVKDICKFLMTVITVFYMCPIATVLITIVYIGFYRFYLSQQNAQLLDRKTKMIGKNSKLHSKYSRINANLFDYVIHHEKDLVVTIKNQLKIDIRRQWFALDYLYEYLSFEETILGRFCTCIILLLHCTFDGSSTLIIPLYHHLKILTDIIRTILRSYIRWIKLEKDYDIVRPILEEFHERINAEQIELNNQLQIENLSFQYQGAREGFHLQSHGLLTFQMGEAILITGQSGAGKSTFFDILGGIISKKDYSAVIRIDDQQESLHSIEKCRTMVLQDSRMDYRSSIYSMITEIDEDQVEQRRTPESDALVWHFLQLVQIDEFVRDELKSDLHQPLGNKLSGGQKTRLLLARALYRADSRHCSLMILDEPDQGLPAETTVIIIDNIIKWYRTKGILFLTLHTERAQLLDFDQVLQIEQGMITKIK